MKRSAAVGLPSTKPPNQLRIFCSMIKTERGTQSATQYRHKEPNIRHQTDRGEENDRAKLGRLKSSRIIEREKSKNEMETENRQKAQTDRCMSRVKKMRRMKRNIKNRNMCKLLIKRDNQKQDR